jgi:hypothetical protein
MNYFGNSIVKSQGKICIPANAVEINGEYDIGVLIWLET